MSRHDSMSTSQRVEYDDRSFFSGCPDARRGDFSVSMALCLPAAHDDEDNNNKPSRRRAE